MRSRPAAGAAALVCAGVLAAAVAGCGGSSARAPSAVGPTVTPPHSVVRLTLGAAGRPVPRGFLGLSIEFQAVRAYTGTDPAAVNPVLQALIRNLSPGQPPMLRIGGDSTDISWLPAPGVRRPPFRGYRLTRGWLATTAALAHDVGARMILGLNLAADEPALDAAEARGYLAAFGRASIEGLEIGNEPNLYATLRQFTTRDGRSVTPRARTFDPPQYEREFDAIVAALPRAAHATALVGPALAAGPVAADAGVWTTATPGFLRAEPRVSQLTVHRYPFKNCFLAPSSPQFPTLARLLSPAATVSLAAGVRLWAAIAHAVGRTLRVDELNSAACRGRPGVSDTFASSLWATDALFSLLNAGVDAVNFHTLPGSSYELFQFSRRDGRWRAWVRPVYYGLALFARAAPVGSRLVSVHGAVHTRRLSVWATRSPDGSDRLVLIDKDPGHAETVELPVPAGAQGAVTVQRMTAPRVQSTGGVTLGGRSYGRVTTTGALRAPITAPAPRARGTGDVVVRVPGASAALVTFGAS